MLRGERDKGQNFKTLVAISSFSFLMFDMKQ